MPEMDSDFPRTQNSAMFKDKKKQTICSCSSNQENSLQIQIMHPSKGITKPAACILQLRDGRYLTH